jgi:hypothetical protein
VPRALPPEVLGCWSADKVIASATVLTSRPSAAVAAVETLVPEVTSTAVKGSVFHRRRHSRLLTGGVMMRVRPRRPDRGNPRRPVKPYAALS